MINPATQTRVSVKSGQVQTSWGKVMFEGMTLHDLRKQMEEHLLMVEEVLGGLDTYVQQLEGRVVRIEKVLGLEPEGLETAGALAQLQRLAVEVKKLSKMP